MRRIYLTLAAGVVLGSLLACGKSVSSGLGGKWRVDLPSTIEQARAIGASASDLEQVRDMFEGGEMTISSKSIVLSLDGGSVSRTIQYELQSVDGECTTLKTEVGPGSHRYCVSGSQLKVHDPSTPLVVVYARR